MGGKDRKNCPEDRSLASRACRVMTNGDSEGQIFLSYPHTNNGFFFLLTNVFIYLFENKHPDVTEYEIYMMTLLDVLGKMAWVR